MKFALIQTKKMLAGAILLASFSTFSVFAGGEVGDHVNHLSDNIKNV